MRWDGSQGRRHADEAWRNEAATILDNLPVRRCADGSLPLPPLVVGSTSAVLDNLPEPRPTLSEPAGVDRGRKARRESLRREWRPLRCVGREACGQTIPPDEVAYWHSGAEVRCHRCARPRVDESSWEAARPCDWCSRPLSIRTGSRRRVRLFCDRNCQTYYYSARQTHQRNVARAMACGERPCAVCGKAFSPSRRDARLCSSACRKRVFRQGKAQPK